ncbi:hypothetical protein LAZ40_01575 [Cereibacter sphaeroides]|uniref:hypothetical protein n=1 Tax=Cereibacter sphaeroides TaxID=1063 RepID=UPI001F191DA4|nr:hypothetical protein [Cereibacter sphaeroides]MCE6957750.1 hypothetical protein [Cereibacter sphaeroides]MCE6971624.1 hypothetical protein [Cereibacter sphaeroides]
MTITLTKRGEGARISLAKAVPGPIRISATWFDNGDARSDNDDLDLRAGILLPDGTMHWLAASHPGSLTALPFARHCGDIRKASASDPGTEIIEVDPEIFAKLGGPVGMVFSVYSAMSNGDVSIASLKPRMRIEHGGQSVDCVYAFEDGAAAAQVYTYVIGTVDIDAGGVDVRLSGLTSAKGSEDTPWIERKPEGLVVSFDGTPVFKKGRGLFGRFLGAGKKQYRNA